MFFFFFSFWLTFCSSLVWTSIQILHANLELWFKNAAWKSSRKWERLFSLINNDFFFYIINICRIFQFDLYFFFLKSLCTNTFNSCSASCWPCRVSTWIWMSTQVLLSSSHERLPWPLFSCCSSAMAIFPVCLVTHWKRCWKKNAHA